MNEDALLQLQLQPTEAGRLATEARVRMFGNDVCIRTAPPAEAPTTAAIIRGDTVLACDAWPAPASIRAGDRVVLEVAANDGERRRYVRWLALAARALPEDTSVAPFCVAAGGLHRLWCVAAARLRLPKHVRVEVRHDLIGTRLAQVALGFGADTLAGPVTPERKLPLAGVPRPNEATRTGLAHLITQTGLTPQ